MKMLCIRCCEGLQEAGSSRVRAKLEKGMDGHRFKECAEGFEWSVLGMR